MERNCLFAEAAWVLNGVGLGWLFRFRLEAWEDILSSIVVWVRMDIDLRCVESSQF